MIIRAVDREYWNSLTGNYFLCALAYSGTTAQMLANEEFLANQVSVENNQLFSFWIYNDDYMNFEMVKDEFRSNSLTIIADLSVYNSQGDQSVVRDIDMRYMLCLSDNCNVTINSTAFTTINKH